MALLEVQDLKASFKTPRGDVAAIRGLSFQVEAGQTTAIVGESGSGKSVTALSILRLLNGRDAHVEGRILLEGVDLMTLPEAAMRRLRGGAIGMVFQDPMSSLNPALTIGAQIIEALQLHQPIGRAEAGLKAVGLLTQVGIAAPERRIKDYPHQLSGGMRQRVMIAMALACDPKLLIADEPTTALDVTVQAQILALIRALQARSGSAVIFITHDLGVVAELADRVIVLYAGRKVEEASVRTIFTDARHPYTLGLLGAMPRRSVPGQGRRARLTAIPGAAPALGAVTRGCAFAARCPAVLAICAAVDPPLSLVGDAHLAACHRVEMAPA
jgi:peptide/nickel transport system ATP-binding protein